MVNTKHIAAKSTGGKARREALARLVASKTQPQTGDAHRRRFRPGIVALLEIRKLQESTDLLIRKLPFQKLVREVVQGFKGDKRFQAGAIEALQHPVEPFLAFFWRGTRRSDTREACSGNAERGLACD